MAFNIFNKVYVAPDYAYDVAFDRYVFSAGRNEAEYASDNNPMDIAGYNTSVLHTSGSINDIIGTGTDDHESIAHFIKSLYDNDIDAKLYCDDASYMPLFFTWLKIAFPDINSDKAFTIYNLIKQRETMVMPDNTNNRTHVTTRLADYNATVILTKTAFVTEYNQFNTDDTVTDAYYTTVRNALKGSFCIELELASYLYGSSTIAVITPKLKRIVSKVLFAVVDDTRQYIRDNILTAKVRTMTGVIINVDDANWEGTLRAESGLMDFLFNSSEDSIVESSSYRTANATIALDWCQWVLDNTVAADSSDAELNDIISGAQWLIDYRDIFSDTDATSQTSAAALITADIAYQGSTIVFQNEYLREKINSFWIEYIYQLKSANSTDLNLISN
jgi:hypothetical protein